ncbi:zinc-ribbon domain-containing protein, partial [Teichococcus wenyumeiae]
MRIECPACGAAYEVPEHLLTRPDGTPARPVRCLRCGQEWQPAAQAPESPPSPPASPSRAEAA